MTFGSLFAGIGGFDLGLERAGMTPVWQVEIDPFCRRVLAKHWPDVRRYEDVRTVHGRRACPDGLCDRCLPDVDLLCGGFPCQDISEAGKGAGIDGERSGLWREMFRLICELQPGFVVVENVSALLHRGMGRVLGDLAGIRYDAEWDSFRACAFGLPHVRERVFIVAYPHGRLSGASRAPQEEASSAGQLVNGGGSIGNLRTGRAVEPAVDRMVHGLPGVVDRIRPFGNAVVPAIPEWIGRRIMAAQVSE